MTFNTSIKFSRPLTWFKSKFNTNQFKTIGSNRMTFFMFRARENFEIFYSVIKTIMINMMHMLFSIKFSIKMFFHNHSMLRFPFACFRYFYLPIKSLFSIIKVLSVFSSGTQRPEFKHTHFPSFSRFFSIHSFHTLTPAGFSFSRGILFKYSLSQFFSGFRTEWMAFLKAGFIRVSHKEPLYAI